MKKNDEQGKTIEEKDTKINVARYEKSVAHEIVNDTVMHCVRS